MLFSHVKRSATPVIAMISYGFCSDENGQKVDIKVNTNNAIDVNNRTQRLIWLSPVTLTTVWYPKIKFPLCPETSFRISLTVSKVRSPVKRVIKPTFGIEK